MSFLEKRQEEKNIHNRNYLTGLVLFICGAIMIVACAYDYFINGSVNSVILGVGACCFIFGIGLYAKSIKELNWIKAQEEREAVEKYQ